MTVKSAGAVWVALNVFTEGLDFIEVLWNSIPEELRTPRWSKNADGSWNKLDMNDKLADLYEHWDEINLAELLEHFVNNQVEDFVYGQIGKAGGRATAGTGVTFGLNTAMRRASNEVGRATGPTANPIPVLVHDAATGAWSVEWQLFGLSHTLER